MKLILQRKMPNSAKELANIGEIGGQLGILGVENLSAFTDTVAKLASVSECSAEEGGAALAKIANQFKIPIKQAKNMGSVLNELSNISTATAPTIAELTSRMAGAGASLGLTMPQISAIGAALTDMGVNAEVGGTAMSDMFMEMMKRTDEYAKVAGVSTAEFKAMSAAGPMRRTNGNCECAPSASLRPQASERIWSAHRATPGSPRRLV